MTQEVEQIRQLKEKFLYPEELTALLTAASASIRDHAIFLTAYSHGMRISEIGLLQYKDFDQEKNRIFIRRLKGGYSNWYAIAEEVKKAIKKWLIIRGNRIGPLFPSRLSHMVDGGKGITYRQLDVLFKVYAERGGLSQKHRVFHTLRHTCAVNMVDKDIPMKQIQDWLGHTSIKSTLIYANVSEAKRGETAERFLEGGLLGGVAGKRKKGAEEEGKINWSKDKVRKKG